MEAQISPVMAMHAGDYNEDGYKDLLLGGNLYDVKPSLGGRQDASYGLLLKGSGDGGFTAENMQDSGFYVKGEIRAILPLLTSQDDQSIVVVKNNQPLQVFKRVFERNAAKPASAFRESRHEREKR